MLKKIIEATNVNRGSWPASEGFSWLKVCGDINVGVLRKDGQ